MLVRPPCIQQDIAAGWHGVQDLDQCAAIEKADLVGQFHMKNLAAKVPFHHGTEWTADAAEGDEADRHGQADSDPDEEGR